MKAGKRARTGNERASASEMLLAVTEQADALAGLLKSLLPQEPGGTARAEPPRRRTVVS
jgi:hypothetical protein